MHFSGPCRNRSCTCTSWQNSKRTGMDYPSTMDLRGVRTWGSSAWNLDHRDQGPTSSLSLSKIYKSLQRRLDLYTYIRERTWDWLYLIAKVKHKKPTDNTIRCLKSLTSMFINIALEISGILHDHLAPVCAWGWGGTHLPHDSRPVPMARCHKYVFLSLVNVR